MAYGIYGSLLNGGVIRRQKLTIRPAYKYMINRIF